MHVIFITSYAGNFNGRDYKERGQVYGSELACIRVAQELTRWHEVTVFVNDDVDEVVDKVRYVSWGKYGQVCFASMPDVCIVSRYVNFFLYNTNYAKRTFVWCHDCFLQSSFEGKSLPSQGSHLLKNLLPTIERIVCVGYAQRDQFFVRQASIDPQKLAVIPNGLIETDRKPKRRVKNSFVWCSNPMQRNLDILLRLFPMITLMIPDATLDIYYSDLSKELQTLVDQQPNVTHHGKVSHERMLEVFEQTDYWLYPTKFFETCCTVAFETAYHGCVQITSNVGALRENVKGIVIEHDPLSEEFERELLRTLEYLQANPDAKERVRARQRQFAEQQTWQRRGLMWRDLLERGSVETNTRAYTNWMVGAPTDEVAPFIRRTPVQEMVFPSDTRRYGEAMPTAVDLTWMRRIREFVKDDTQSYLGLFHEGRYSSQLESYYFFILDEIADRPKIRVAFLLPGSQPYEKERVSLRKKIDLASIRDASLILTKKAAHELLNKPFEGRTFAELAYDTFTVNARTCTNEPVFTPKTVQYPLATSKVTIGAAIMMKNEERTVETTLRAAAPYVNAFVVYDTGSTDRTVDVCRQWCEREGIPLHLHEGTFVDFCVSRNTMISYAEKNTKLDFLLLLDVGDEVRNGEHMWSHITANPQQYAFYVNQFWDLGSDTQNLSYRNVRVISTHRDLRYIYPVHEVVDVNPIVTDKDRSTIGQLDTVVYQDRTTDLGKSNRRWIRDKQIIQRYLMKHPKHPRMTFYLAQTYKCLKEDQQAYTAYKKRLDLGGFQDEIQQSYIEMYKLSTRNTFVSDEEIRRHLEEGWKRYVRFEFAHYLAESYASEAEKSLQADQPLTPESKALYERAYEWATRACQAPYPTNVKLWIERIVFTHHRWRTLAITSYYSGHHAEGIVALREAMKVQPSQNIAIAKAYAAQGYPL